MSRKIIYYRSDLKEKSRELRKNCTIAEKILWRYLRNKQLRGYQFYRQKPIDNYIVDFFCFELMLAIEIDGITHIDKLEYDVNRDHILRDKGIFILHIYDSEVHKNITGVLETIDERLNKCEKHKV